MVREIFAKERSIFAKCREVFFKPESISEGFTENHPYFRPESNYDPLSNPEELGPRL